MISPLSSQKSANAAQKSAIRNQNARGSKQDENLDGLIEGAYSQGKAANLGLGLLREDFTAHLKSIIARELGADAAQGAATKLTVSLNAEDLYLTAACAHNSEPAWDRFSMLYNDHIGNVAHSICSSSQEARELASGMLGYLFVPDAKGRSRVASYAGRGSLRAWLATIIKHRFINQSQLKSNRAIPLDSIRQVRCPRATNEFEAELLSGKYGEAIRETLGAAAGSLTEREKLVLVLHIDGELTAAAIARRFDVHRAQMTRTIHRAKAKLEMAVFTRLTAHHQLSLETTEECISEIVRCKEISLAAFLRAALNRPTVSLPPAPLIARIANRVSQRVVVWNRSPHNARSAVAKSIIRQ